jgi:hypothetical protein
MPHHSSGRAITLECSIHASKIAPAMNTHPDAKIIHLAIATLRCLCSIESRANDAGGFFRRRNLPSQAQTRKSTTAPTTQTTIGKSDVTGCSFHAKPLASQQPTLLYAPARRLI